MTAQRPRVQSAARAVGILLAIAQSERGLTAAEISASVGIPRQATYHLLHTLSQTGMLTRIDRHRYVLGLRVGTLAAGFQRQLSPSEHLAPMVRVVAHRTGETSYAAGWKDGEVATFAVVRGTNPVQAAEIPQGYVGNAHARASGKLLLSFAADDVRDTYLDRHPLVAVGPRTRTDPAALRREFDTIRANGFAIDDEEYAAGLFCIAVPLDSGHSPFALAISGPRERMVANRDAYLAALAEVADHAKNDKTEESTP